MRRESLESSHRAASFPQHALRTSEEVAAELLLPCSRFRTPDMPLEDRLQTFAIEQFHRNAALNSVEFQFGSGTPLNWQQILRYLHREQVIATPEVRVPHFKNDRPHTFSFQFDPMHSDASTDGHRVLYQGFGGSLSREVALSKAVGEILERYYLATYKREWFLPTSFSRLSGRRTRVINMREYDFFYDWQKKLFPALDYDEHSVMHWALGEEYTTGRQVYLPAQLIYWNYRHSSPTYNERMIYRQTSSGGAGHFTKEEAVLSALVELIEREGFVIYWLNSLSPKVIDMRAVSDPDITGFVSYLQRFGLQVEFVDTTSDLGVPSATCIITDPTTNPSPSISIASSAGFDFKSIILHSAIEAMIISNFVATQEQYVLPDTYKPFSDGKLGRNQRMTAWRGEKMAERFTFFTRGTLETPEEFMRNTNRYTTPGQQLSYILETLRRRGDGHEVYVFEVKNNILKQLGYHIVRTIVPRLVPLYLEEFSAPLRARRLRESVENMGLAPAREFNRWPHLFP